MEGHELTADVFEPLVGTEFTVPLADGAVYALELGSCTRGEPAPGAPRPAPFVLVFLGPPGGHLPQHTARLAHEVLREVEIFLVPLGPRPGDGRQQYEAVFN